jgi:hypoxanthine phosphoribosyltransferase
LHSDRQPAKFASFVAREQGGLLLVLRKLLHSAKQAARHNALCYGRLRRVEASQLNGDLTQVLVTKEQLATRITEMAAEIDRDYEGKELLLVGVLNGAVMVMADLSRALNMHCRMDWMAVSSYGSGSKSSGVVRILKDLSTDVTGMHVLLVEDIIDTGLTLSYLVSNLRSRGPASLRVLTVFRKPEAARNPVEITYVGFDIPNEFVVGYGLDYDGLYRNLTSVGALSPSVYSTPA